MLSLPFWNLYICEMQNWELLCPYDCQNKRIFFFLHKTFSSLAGLEQNFDLYDISFILIHFIFLYRLPCYVFYYLCCAVQCRQLSCAVTRSVWGVNTINCCSYYCCWLWNCCCGSGRRGRWRCCWSRPSCASWWPRRCRWTRSGSTWWRQAVMQFDRFFDLFAIKNLISIP